MIEMTPTQLAYAGMLLKDIMDLTLMLNEVNGLSEEECDQKMLEYRAMRDAERKRLDSQ